MAKKRESKARTNPETTVTLSEFDIAMIDALGILFNIAIAGETPPASRWPELLTLESSIGRRLQSLRQLPLWD